MRRCRIGACCIPFGNCAEIWSRHLRVRRLAHGTPISCCGWLRHCLIGQDRGSPRVHPLFELRRHIGVGKGIVHQSRDLRRLRRPLVFGRCPFHVHDVVVGRSREPRCPAGVQAVRWIREGSPLRETSACPTVRGAYGGPFPCAGRGIVHQPRDLRRLRRPLGFGRCPSCISATERRASAVGITNTVRISDGRRVDAAAPALRLPPRTPKGHPGDGWRTPTPQLRVVLSGVSCAAPYHDSGADPCHPPTSVTSFGC